VSDTGPLGLLFNIYNMMQSVTYFSSKKIYCIKYINNRIKLNVVIVKLFGENLILLL